MGHRHRTVERHRTRKLLPESLLLQVHLRVRSLRRNLMLVLNPAAAWWSKLLGLLLWRLLILTRWTLIVISVAASGRRREAARNLLESRKRLLEPLLHFERLTRCTLVNRLESLDVYVKRRKDSVG